MDFFIAGCFVGGSASLPQCLRWSFLYGVCYYFVIDWIWISAKPVLSESWSSFVAHSKTCDYIYRSRAHRIVFFRITFHLLVHPVIWRVYNHQHQISHKGRNLESVYAFFALLFLAIVWLNNFTFFNFCSNVELKSQFIF